MTVRDLINLLLDQDMDAPVFIGKNMKHLVPAENVIKSRVCNTVIESPGLVSFDENNAQNEVLILGNTAKGGR